MTILTLPISCMGIYAPYYPELYTLSWYHDLNFFFVIFLGNLFWTRSIFECCQVFSRKSSWASGKLQFSLPFPSFWVSDNMLYNNASSFKLLRCSLYLFQRGSASAMERNDWGRRQGRFPVLHDFLQCPASYQGAKTGSDSPFQSLT